MVDCFNEAGLLTANRDIWAIGVITYFLLCGYTPFDRDSNLEEMQAILEADYSFPVEYWRGVSDTAKAFIAQCLTVDPNNRPTAHQALTHPWLKEDETMDDAPVRRSSAGGAQKGREGPDLLPTVRKNFNARVKLHAAIDTIRAINQLRAGGAAAQMNGARSMHPQHGAPALNRDQAKAGLDGQGAMLASVQPHGEEMEGVEATGQLGSKDVDAGVEKKDSGKEIDGRGHGRGQTPQQIEAHTKKINDTIQGLWSGRR